MTLDDLLNSLEKQASEAETKEKKDKDESEDEGKYTSKEDDKLKSAEKDLEEAKEKGDRVKEAQLQGSALANEIMQKVASANTSKNKETQMNKSAQFAGQALAQSLLTKLASAGDFNTDNGIYQNAAPTKAQIDAAQLVAEQDMTIDPTPTKDAAGNGGGSINQIFDAIIAKAMAQGAVSTDQVHGTGIAQGEGVIEDRTAPGNAGSQDEVEKVAAVNALMNSGFDIFSAVDMVKAAEQEILYEEEVQVKQAAMDELIGAGVDFELAAAMVKQAGRMDQAKAALGAAKSYVGGKASQGAAYVGGKIPAGVKGAYGNAAGYAGRGVDAVRGYAGGVAQDARELPTLARDLITGNGAGRRVAAGMLATNRAAQLGAGLGAVGAVGAGGYALAREKKAAFDGLIEAGVDFDSAAALVSETSQELYGA